MTWMQQLVMGESVAQAMVVIGLVAIGGLALGSLKYRGVGLGVAGVLFAGLAFGHFGVKVNPEVADFVREFGLILFVYTIGIQVGPGFFSSLKKNGAPLNAMAAGIVILGGVLAWAAHRFAGVDLAAAAGLFSGATTNTPSLGAAQEAVSGLPGVTAEMARMPGLAYAVAYPFGVVGIILAMLLLKAVLRISIPDQEEKFRADLAKVHPRLETRNLRVTNANLEGMKIADIPGLAGSGVVVSRIQCGGGVGVARPETVLHVGDIFLAVGPPEPLQKLRVIVGEESDLDLRTHVGALTMQRIVVTRKVAIGKSLADLGLEGNRNVRFTRLSRAEIDLPDPLNRRLQAGDTLTVVGEEDSLKAVAKDLGNSMKDLNHPQIIPVFLGIVLGVTLGSIPFFLPGMPAPVKLGLAGGPLLAAILLSHIGRIGPLVWYMPANANFLLREIGIVMFLAVVGLKSGGKFMETLLMGDGMLWLVCGAAITLLPLLIVGAFGLLVLRQNFLTMTGVLAGSMTDPPALAFANSTTTTPAPSLSYATVYPLTMLLRVLAVQVLVLFLG